MSAPRTALALLGLTLVLEAASALNLADLLQAKSQGAAPVGPYEKRGPSSARHFIPAGNPCREPEKPFPCKSGSKSAPTCIPMGYVCDDSYDCDDGSDEEKEMCTALDRPPVEDIVAFLYSQQRWIIPHLFGGKQIEKVAHSLAVSQTVDDFRRRLGLKSDEVKGLRQALDGVRDGNEEALEDLGMPRSAWPEVMFIFQKLIQGGFA